MAVRVKRGEVWRLHRPHPDKRQAVIIGIPPIKVWNVDGEPLR